MSSPALAPRGGAGAVPRCLNCDFMLRYPFPSLATTTATATATTDSAATVAAMTVLTASQSPVLLFFSFHGRSAASSMGAACCFYRNVAARGTLARQMSTTCGRTGRAPCHLCFALFNSLGIIAKPITRRTTYNQRAPSPSSDGL